MCEQGKPSALAVGRCHSDSKPRVSAQEIAAAFGVSTGGVFTRVGAIKQSRQASGVPVDGFMTKQAKSSHRQIDEIYGQMAALLSGLDMTPAPEAPALRSDGSFFDAKRDVMEDYYEIVSQPPTQLSTLLLQRLIERDPDFYDSYTALAELSDATEARRLHRTAYERAVARLAPDGVWPRLVDGGFLENRHVLRALLNEAIARWNDNDPLGATPIFQQLLAICPEDSLGARYYLLAICEHLHFPQFEQRFSSSFGYNASKLMHWFNANVGKYPTEFAPWRREAL